MTAICPMCSRPFVESIGSVGVRSLVVLLVLCVCELVPCTLSSSWSCCLSVASVASACMSCVKTTSTVEIEHQCKSHSVSICTSVYSI